MRGVVTIRTQRDQVTRPFVSQPLISKVMTN